MAVSIAEDRNSRGEIQSAGSPEEKLRAAERRLKGLINASAQVVWTTDANGIPTEDSPTWRAFTGQSREEWLGQNGWQAIHPDHREHARQLWVTATQTGLRFETTYLVKHASGEWRWMRARAIPLRFENGEIEGWIGLNDDISELKAAEKSLRESEILFRSVTETIPDLLWIADPQAQVFFWNQSWYSYTGRSVEDSLGIAAVDAIREDVREKVLKEWISSIQEGREFIADIPLRHHSGSYRWFSARARPIRNSEGRIFRWAGVMTDIDDLTSSIQRLREEREIRERFVAGLTHDLKNPLMTARMSIQMCARGMQMTSDQERRFDVFMRATLRMENMINDLLDANILQAGKEFSLSDLAPIDLKPLLHSVVNSFGHARNVVLALSPEDELRGQWSEKSLTRLIENLVANAIKYGDRERPISVSAKREPGFVLLIVHNWGNPIPSAEQRTLFDFLTRATTAHLTGQSGWGIGLTLVKGIAEAHGGEVSLESSSEHGTFFRVKLPVKPD